MARPHPNDARATELIDEYISGTDDWRGASMARIRELVHEADPDIEETFKWRGNPVWEHDGIVCLVGAFKGKVKVTFQQGAHVDDPKGIFNNGLDGGQWRAIDLYEKDALDEDGFKDLVTSAVAYNQAKKK